MELLKAGGFLFVIGLLIVVAAASMKGAGIIGKVAIGIGQVVCLIAVIVAAVGIFQWAS